MAFKLKNAGGTFKTMGSSASPNKAGGYVKPGGKATGKMGDYALNSQARRDEYDARGWAHDKTTKVAEAKAAPAAAPAAAPEKTKKREFEATDASNRQGAEGTGSQTVKNAIGRGSKTYSTSADGKTNTVTKNRADGSVRKVKESKNRSTWDPETGTGSSGLGMQTTTTKRKKDGSQRGKQKTTYSMGTDSKKDDKVTKSKVGKRKQTLKTKNDDLHSGGKGTSKTKHYTKGKKAGTSVTKERKKGQLFGKKVDVDYS